jgi:hypothetical protein
MFNAFNLCYTLVAEINTRNCNLTSLLLQIIFNGFLYIEAYTTNQIVIVRLNEILFSYYIGTANFFSF